MSNYNAEDIEVLTGLEPVRKRPGMYTDTTRPNHLAQEVIDNSVDEALAGHASQIDVVLHRNGSVTVADDGRGMPVDMHPEQGKPGVEVLQMREHPPEKLLRDVRRPRLVGMGKIIAAWRCGPPQGTKWPRVQSERVAHIIEADGVSELRVEQGHQLTPVRESAGQSLRCFLARQL